MQMNYIALAKGLNHRQLVPVNHDITKIVKSSPTQDFYTSIYRYQDHHVAQFENTGSLSGLTGVTTPKILFDFDSALDIEAARKDALEVCARLIKHGVEEEYIRIYWSGMKGFYVEIITDCEMSRQEFVNVVFGLAGDLKTFDTKIQDEQRIIRAPLSRHPISKLYKIPLKLADLASMSIDDIKIAAKDASRYEMDADDLYVIQMPEALNILRSKEFKKVGGALISKDIKGFDIKDIDVTDCPKWMEPARYVLSQGYFYGSENVAKGERNSAFMILAATFRKQGFSAEHTLALLSVTAQKQALRAKEDPYTDEQLQREIINAVFSPSWSGGIYGKDEELLVTTRDRFKLTDRIIETESVGIENVGFGFKDFVRNIDKNRIYTGLKSLDQAVVMTSGMLVSLLAAPGAGKTSLANSFVETLNINGENTLYFSLDLYKNLLFNRLLQKYSKYDFQKILEQYKNDEPDEVLLQAYADVLQNYSKVAFNFKTGISIDELEIEVKNHVELIGKSPKLIVVDYLEKIRTPFSDATASTSYAAGRLADIAKKYDTTVLLLVQPSKVGGGDPRDEFKNYRAIKGSSAIESESRVILGLFRPGYNPADSSEDNFATISVLKNNTGPLGRFDHYWDGVSGTLHELDSDGRRDLAKLRNDLDERANHRDDI